MGSRKPRERLFVYHDMRPIEQQQRIGEYVVGVFPNHITLGTIHTSHSAEVCAAIESVAVQYPSIPLTRGGMFLTNGRRRKPAIHIEDPTRQLHEFQRNMLRAAACIPDTHISRGSLFVPGIRSPHVSVAYLELGAEAPRVPLEFELGWVSTVLTDYDAPIDYRNLLLAHSELEQCAYEQVA